MIKEIAEIKIRLSRGQSLFYEVKNALILATGIKILFETSLETTIILTIFGMIAFYFLGWFDLRFLKLFQKEQELTTEKYNPYLGSLKHAKINSSRRRLRRS